VSSDRDFRQEALSLAIQQRPDLAGPSSPESRKELSDLATQLESELRLQYEVDEIRRKEFAEQARRQGERARRQRREEEVNRAREERLRAEQQRELRVSSMPPAKRFFYVHRAASVIAVVVVGVVALVAVLGVTRLISDTRERAASEARSAAEAQASVEALARAEASAAAEQQRLDQLATLCDLNAPESDISDEVWIAWLRCSDEAVVTKAAQKADLTRLTELELTELARETQTEALAKRISLLLATPLEAHEALISAWSPEVVAESYRKYYKQECTEGMRPEDYIGDTKWKTDSGRIVEFKVAGCRIVGFPDTTRTGTYFTYTDSNDRWKQLPDELRVASGYNYYAGNGRDAYVLIEGNKGAPQSMTRME